MAGTAVESADTQQETSEDPYHFAAELKKLGLRKLGTGDWGASRMRDSLKNGTVHNETQMPAEALSEKVEELRAALGPLKGRAKIFCTDDCLCRYLRARNGNVKKAEKMLRETLQWREAFKPEEIRWSQVSQEGETGKIYKTNFRDKLGRTVLVFAPGKQNTSNHQSQIQHLVYCLENAVMTLDPGFEKIAWLIDFRNWTVKTSPPLKTALETLNILQNHYPERLGVAVCYDPPKIFEAFWNVIKPFVDPTTRTKVKFIYPGHHKAMKLLEEQFDLDTLEKSFGGRSTWEFDIDEYSSRMAQDDMGVEAYWRQAEMEELGSVKQAWLDGC